MDAKKTLGFPPDATPSDKEVNLAQRKKLVEMNYRGLGGDADPKEAVNVNVVAEILKGNYRADDQPRIRRPTTEDYQPRPKREPPKTVDTIKGKPFSEGVAGVPNADWKFIAKPEWCQYPSNDTMRGYSGDCWVVFGDTPEDVIVVGIKVRKSNIIFDHDKGGNVEIEEDWDSYVVKIPKKHDLVKMAPGAVKRAVTNFKDLAVPRRPPQKFVVWPGGSLEKSAVESVKTGSGGAHLKDILLSTGMVSEDHAGLQGRKTNVEVIPHYSRDKQKRLRAERGGGAVYSYECFDFEVRVNGKSAVLNDTTVKNLKDNHFMIGVFSYDPHDNVPKNLTKLRGGFVKFPPADAIRLLYEALSGEPGWLHEVLKKASEEYVVPTKEARAAVRVVMTSA